MSELKPCPICKGTRICMDGGDNTYHPRCLDCGCTAPFDAWQSRTPAPVEVERLVDDLLSVSKQLGQSEARGLYDHIEPAEVAINDLKSRLLAALTSGDGKRADLTDALVEAAEKVVLAIDEAQIVWILDAGKKLKSALAAYRGDGER